MPRLISDFDGARFVLEVKKVSTVLNSQYYDDIQPSFSCLFPFNVICMMNPDTTATLSQQSLSFIFIWPRICFEYITGTDPNWQLATLFIYNLPTL